MPPTCNICMERFTNYNTKCITCKKMVCNECYNKLSKFQIDDEDNVMNGYNCPFCRTEICEDLETIDSSILVEMTKEAVIDCKALYKEKLKIERRAEQLQSIIEYYKNQIKQQHQLKEIYNEFVERYPKRKTIQLEKLKKMILSDLKTI
jgi:hypothetical protein